MNISVDWHQGKFPSFNLSLSSKEGAEPFFVVKGCRIVSGAKGEFVSYPSRKQDDGKYWNHCWGSDKFNAVVLSKALEAQRPAKAREDVDSSIPF